jgi:hypothetical protein
MLVRKGERLPENNAHAQESPENKDTHDEN